MEIFKIFKNNKIKTTITDVNNKLEKLGFTRKKFRAEAGVIVNNTQNIVELNLEKDQVQHEVKVEPFETTVN